MSLPFDAVTLFAEDVREETQGTLSLIGILPDTLAVPGVPAALPKLAIYTRVHVPIDIVLESFAVVVRMLDGSEVDVGGFSSDLLTDTRALAQAEGKTFYGLIGHAIASPFPVPSIGTATAFIRYGEVEHIIGAVNFKVAG